MAETKGFEPSRRDKPSTPLAGERLQPLGHVSTDRIRYYDNAVQDQNRIFRKPGYNWYMYRKRSDFAEIEGLKTLLGSLGGGRMKTKAREAPLTAVTAAPDDEPRFYALM